MGRAYAGILGPVAFVTVIVRAAIHGGDASQAVAAALVALGVFALLGLILGTIAERVIREAIEMRFRDQWNELQTVDADPRSESD